MLKIEPNLAKVNGLPGLEQDKLSIDDTDDKQMINMQQDPITLDPCLIKDDQEQQNFKDSDTVNILTGKE